jgi:radical SAM superfamily enzyme YgiQ (UPF0313 family)
MQLKRYTKMTIQYSRGCPFNGEFCNIITLLWHRPRVKTARQIIHELEKLYLLDWHGSVFFVDDNLIENNKHLKGELLPASIKWRKAKVGLKFSTEVSTNLADDEELMTLMYKAGFNTVFIGIETSDEGNLIEDIKRIQRHGMHVQGGLITGLDSNTPAISNARLISYKQAALSQR